MKFVGRKTNGAKATLRRFPMFSPKPKVGERFVRAWAGSFQVFYVIFVGYIWLILYLIYIMIYIFCIYVAVFQMMIIWLWTIESKYDMPNILDRTFCFSLPMTGKHSPSWLVQIEEEERQKTGEEFQQKWEEWEEGRRMVACWSTNKQILEN